MISERYDIIEFIGKVKDEKKTDIILKAHDESTMAERFFLKHYRTPTPECRKSRHYADQLKMLITYLRHNVRGAGLPAETVQLLKPRIHA